MRTLELEPAIRAQRVALRAPQPGDAARIAQLLDDPAIARMAAAIPHPYGLADAEAFLARAQAADPSREAAFVIEHGQDGAIGMLDFQPAAQNAAPELGYWLGRPYWGQGLATEAVRAALAWARQTWRRRFVRAGHFADNPASGQVLCKAGFLYTGEVQLRDSLARPAPATTRMMVWLA